NENAGPKTGVRSAAMPLSVELEAGERPGEVGADGALHAPGLQRDRAARAADQPVGAEADAEAGFGRAADIAAGECAAPDVAGGGGEDQPLELGAVGDTEVDAQLADGAAIGLGLVALADELAGQVLLRADDVADAAFDVAGKAPDLDAVLRGGGHRGGGKDDCGERRGDQLLHSIYPQRCLSPLCAGILSPCRR